ncbi:response regulator [Spirosoma aerophilum]
MENKDALSIFVVDDDPFCQKIYEQHLHQLGYSQVRLFSDGQSCLNLLTELPDVIFLDYQMEPLDGLEVLRKIKRFNPDIYLVVISAQEDLQVAVNALKYGAFDYIIKGHDDFAKMDTVLKKIQDVRALLKQRPAGRWNKLLTLVGLV